MKNKTVMIAGMTGFVGSRLAAMIPAGFELLPAPPRYGMARTADYIIHAAGYAAPSLFMKNPIETIQVNTDLTLRLLRHLNPGGSFLFCSSSEVYKGLEHLADEDEIGTTTPQHPRACYIEGKKCGEVLVKAYRDKGVRALSARVGLTYGPGTRKHDARVMNQFIEQALTKGRIELLDDGSATIPCCYVDDMAKMLWMLVTRGMQGVYNVGSPDNISVAALARQIGKRLGVPVTISKEPRGAPHAKMNLMRYWNEFGQPQYTKWEDGLAATIEYQRGLYGIV